MMTTTLPAEVADRLKQIQLLLLDVDGVLTDGRLGRTAAGEEIKFFSVYDGLAIRMAQNAGLRVGFLSGRTSKEVESRARELGVEIVVQGSRDKAGDLETILAETSLEASQVAYIGDDLPDLSVLKRVGFSAAPGNAAEEVREGVDYVTERKGGEGAVREVVDLLLKAAGKWDDVLSQFL
jgi:3-deoxy-D-manno-octulosonate 8-phosphate phosphatase (KDO 8-P phosphatase)